MTPMFRIVADGADITTLLNVRLLLLGTTDKPGMESDDYELRIDDRDSAVSLPSRGATIEIFLGYLSAALLLTADQITNVLAVIGVVPSFNLRLDPAILLISHRATGRHSMRKRGVMGEWAKDGGRSKVADFLSALLLPTTSPGRLSV